MKKLRLFIFNIIIAAACLLAGCTSPKSPVGTASKIGPASKGTASSGARDPEFYSGTVLDVSERRSAGVSVASVDVEIDGLIPDSEITEGDSEGTHLEFWTYEPLNIDYYKILLNQWNEQDPDYTLEITFKTFPYDELHAALLNTLRTGEGAPDICDVDVYRFAEMSEGLSDWLYPLDVAVAPYIYDVHAARLETYRASDGVLYGAPFRMGAAVQYWNMEVLEQAGITAQDVDAVVTWDDYFVLGEKYKNAAGTGGRYFTAVDGASPVWAMLATGEFSNSEEAVTDAVSRMDALHNDWINSQIAKSSDNVLQEIKTGSIVSFTGGLSNMDDFVKELHDESGKWYITKCPVFEEGQPCSVPLDDIGTVVTAQCKRASLAADFICYAKLYSENARSIMWPTLSYDVCNMTLWGDAEFAHDETSEYNTFFRNYPYDVLNEINDGIATVLP